jgi:hypothetical protein
MTDNPLIGRQPQKPGRVTKEMLDALAERLNRMSWVKQSGKPYFVGKRTNENGAEHFLDRMI